jgi:hypothetical protein
MEQMSAKLLSTLARWMVVLALMLAYWPFGEAHAAEIALIQRIQDSPSFTKTLYTANFEWNGSPAPLRFTIGTVDRKEEGHSRFMALITRGSTPVATCERVITGKAPFDVNSMQLRCDGSLFGARGALALFSFASLTAKPTLMIETGRHPRKLLALNSTEADVGKTAQVAKAN